MASLELGEVSVTFDDSIRKTTDFITNSKDKHVTSMDTVNH